MGEAEADPEVVRAVVFSIRRCLERKGATVVDPVGNQLDALAEYWARATAQLGEDIALQVATEIPIGAFGLVSYGTLSAATLGEAIDVVGSYLGRIVPGLTLRVVQAPNAQVEVHVRGDGPPAFMPLLEEILLARFHMYATILVTPPTVHAVALRRPAPANAKPWHVYFGIAPRFAQRHSLLRLAASDMQIGLRTANAALQATVREAAQKPTDSSTAARVRDYIRTHVRDAIDPDAVARALDLSPRTLQRHLQGENTSLRDLAADVRIAVAKEMLAHTEASIAEIATAVGFSRATSFTRAFTAATNETPQAFRKRHAD